MAVIRGIGMLQAASDHIPNEIIVCILTYLPVKSLLRFKTVSKSWNAIITDPCFVGEHYSRQPSSKLLMVKRPEKEETDGTHIFPMPLSFDTKLCAHRNVYQSVKSYLSDKYSDMLIMGPCFGVYCFLVCNYRERSVKIELCNIATGETKVCRPYLNFGEDGVIFCAFGFGCVHNDIISRVPNFKVVKLEYYVEGSSLKCSTQVYTSATNSWKSAESCESFTYEKGIEVNGVIHWQANSLKATGKKFILTFDLQKEVFGKIERPQGTYSALLTKQDQYLSLITTSNDFVDVWVMHVRGSWVRQATVGPLRVSKTSFLGYWCSVGGLLWKVNRVEDNAEIVMAIRDNHYKFCVPYSDMGLTDYVESLMSFNY
ncbi:hypothetical protein QQ045_016951 [Rhodiola kirilowii]